MNTALPTPRSLKFIYFKYKDSSVVVVSVVVLILVVSAILVFEILLPQVANWFSIQQEVDATKQQIQTLSNNITFIGSFNESTLDQDLQTVSAALPPEKSFTGILNAISDSTVKSNIVLNDYTFNLGTIETEKPVYNQQTLLPIQITLVVEGKLSDITAFLKQLEEKIPLARIDSVTFSHNASTIILTYYFKPFPNISFNDGEAISPLSTETQNLVNKLNSWKPTTVINTAPSQQASYSADPFQ